MHGGKHEEKLLRENTNWFDKFAVKNLNYAKETYTEFVLK